MDGNVAFAIAGLAITVVVGFTTIGRTLGRIELKVDTMWNSFLGGSAPHTPARRREDRIFRGLADDHPEDTAGETSE